nr:cytochrome b [Anaticola crassicornis]
MTKFINILSKQVSDEVVSLPTPQSISYLWNFGSLLGMSLVVQIATGIFLSMHYESSLEEAFLSVVNMTMDLNWGWLSRSVHANGASLFFICIYLHIGRGIYYKSFNFYMVWLTGIMILFMLMAEAFIGYVLPWGQMSLWGATVITNLMSAIPYIGMSIVTWLWGGFSVSSPTLIRFFSIHYVLPFIIIILIISHLIFLHFNGSSNPLGISKSTLKIHFHPYYSFKDIIGFLFVLYLFVFISLMLGDLLMDPDNFSIANPMSTPEHIQPEWYFLFAYAILRSVPNKLGGVVALLLSIVVLAFLPMSNNSFIHRFSGLAKVMFWMQVMNFLILSWLGSEVVEEPFIMIGQVVSILYFTIFIVMIIM